MNFVLRIFTLTVTYLLKDRSEWVNVEEWDS